MACKAGCGLDLDFVHDVFQIWRMEVLPIILILVNVMIIIVVLSSVWTITMISWSSSMLTKWSARKGTEAEGGFEKKDFFEKHSPISLSVTPALKLCDILQLWLKYPPLQYSSSGEHLLHYSSAAEYLLQYSSSGEYLFQYSSSAAHLSSSWYKMEKHECILDEVGNLTRWPHCEYTGAQNYNCMIVWKYKNMIIVLCFDKCSTFHNNI